MVRLAINGFGRIGRNALKVALETKGVEVVAINDLGPTSALAHLLKHDTNYGTYERAVSYDETHLIVDKKKILTCKEKDPNALPWSKLKIDVVLECTGLFTSLEGASAHLKAGAKRVVISAPAKGDGVPTMVLGVNSNSKGAKVVNNASCTTNCISPVVAVIDETFGIAKAMMTTIHAYTADQRLQDATHADLRRARSAAQNIVPTTTGAAIATTEVVPSIKKKFDGLSIRVPVSVVSLSDCTFVLKRSTTIEEVNKALIVASKTKRFKGILDVTNEELVSSDFIKNSHSSIVDLNLTNVVDGNLLKVVAWYDNEWGYANRLVELASQLR